MPPAKIPSFFKTPQPRRFDLKPRYFDPRKEAMERRLANHESGSPAGERIRGAFRKNKNSSDAVRRASNVRLALILVALMVLSYLVFF